MADIDSPDAERKLKAMSDDYHVKEDPSLHGTTSEDVGQVSKPLKSFTLLSMLALGWNITNTGIGMVLVMGSAVFGAGPLFFYSTLMIAGVAFCTAITLGELASAYPHTGGQYFWVAQLAPEQQRRFLSYITAILTWASVICTATSAAQALSSLTFELVFLARPDFGYQRWMGFLCMEAYQMLAALTTIHETFLPKIQKGFLGLSIATTLAIFIALLAPHSEKQTAAAVFGGDGYFNLSGWPDGVAFLVGMSGVNWGFSCLDATAHISEEVPHPRRDVPMAMLCTVGMATTIGIMINLAIFFAATDLPNVTSLIALLDVVYDGNPACAYVLGILVLLVVFNALAGGQALQARIVWALSRDKATPFHAHMSRLAPPPFYTPLWATLWGVCWIGLCGFLYLGSLVAFNSFVSAGILLQYITYSTPAVLLLLYGRSKFPRGPFFWPRFGPVANLVVITWTCLTLVMYSFPLFVPIEAGSMNYTSVVVVFAFLYAGGYWALYGHKHYSITDVQLASD